jgi:hypothetical protein
MGLTKGFDSPWIWWGHNIKVSQILPTHKFFHCIAEERLVGSSRAAHATSERRSNPRRRDASDWSGTDPGRPAIGGGDREGRDLGRGRRVWASGTYNLGPNYA